jgi:hypothetical protein
MTKALAVVGCNNQEIGDHQIEAIHQTRAGWIPIGLSMEPRLFCETINVISAEP